MGDRANVYIKEDAEHGVYLYTHWAGSELAMTVQTALERGQSRWTDGPYLARIIFCEMVAGNERDLTGFGISTCLCDNQHPILVVDSTAQTVGLAPEPTPEAPVPVVDAQNLWTFADFVALTDEQLEKAWGEVNRSLEPRG